MKKIDKDSTQFTIKVIMKNRWIPYFLAMLKRMESLGKSGMSRDVTLYSDGDGGFQPKFKWDDELSSNGLPLSVIEGKHFYDAG